ncbi:ladderlectin-like [Megalobrama amblycephala]|uniref:ladderlectin-like n=1 Tax=Megalobrama amblycephala TaxID=75352 RepID=UPI00201406BB|nr:ladderlectin-like [Megalobrama amblycephala]
MAMLRGLLLLFVIFSIGNAQVNLDKKCPFGWKNFGVRCYKYFSQSADWITAEKSCQSLGANLASVHHKLENDFLLSLLPSSSTRSFIGANDGIKDGQWLWSDGSEYDFTNWCSNEPNNQNGPENCLEINYSSNLCWNDKTCSHQLSYICAIDL